MSVTLLAFGRPGYAVAASNMVASLRFYGYAGPIHLHVGSGLLPLIDTETHARATVIPLEDEYAADPGWCKINLARIFQGEETLYLDVDGVALKDVQGLIDELKKDPRHFMCTVLGTGKYTDRINYYEWAKPAAVKVKHNLPDDVIYYGLQSSWIYLRKGEALSKLNEQMRTIWGQWNRKELKATWGRTMPDELFYSIACTVIGYDPTYPESPVHFGRGFDTLPKLREKYYVLSLYGSGRGTGSVPTRFVECYDAEIRTIRGKEMATRHHSRYVRRDKYVDTK